MKEKEKETQAVKETDKAAEEVRQKQEMVKGGVARSAATILNLLEGVSVSGQRNMELLLQAMNSAQTILGTLQDWPTFAEERKEE